MSDSHSETRVLEYPFSTPFYSARVLNFPLEAGQGNQPHSLVQYGQLRTLRIWYTTALIQRYFAQTTLHRTGRFLLSLAVRCTVGDLAERGQRNLSSCVAAPSSCLAGGRVGWPSG